MEREEEELEEELARKQADEEGDGAALVDKSAWLDAWRRARPPLPLSQSAHFNRGAH